MSESDKKGLILRLAEFFNPFHNKQQRMMAEATEELRLQAPCMTVVNLLEMPGVVKVSGERLVIQPCLGRPTSLNLGDIAGVKSSRLFNGTIRKVQFQHGFWIHGGPGWRLGFAVSDAAPWRALFEENGIPIS